MSKNKNEKKLFYGHTTTSLYFRTFSPKQNRKKQQYDQETIKKWSDNMFFGPFLVDINRPAYHVQYFYFVFVYLYVP